MAVIDLTFFPSREEQPGRIVVVGTVAEALSTIHELNAKNGFQSGTEIRKDKVPIYGGASLTQALSRMNSLRVDEGMSIEDAAIRVAEEDGHSK